MIAHCLFEQSAAFKNAFKKNGIEAFDYDILNDFGETDFQIDLFSEIASAYQSEESIFDNIEKEDLVIAFFPCTRFEDQINLAFRGDSFQMNRWSEIRKLNYDIKLNEERTRLYELICKLAVVAYQRELQMIIENPYSGQHFLKQYWCLKPALIDYDRTLNGDYYKKPTQFWFINCEPKNNILFEPLDFVETKKIKFVKGANRQVQRSMIHPQYADRFIRQYVL